MAYACSGEVIRRKTYLGTPLHLYGRRSPVFLTSQLATAYSCSIDTSGRSPRTHSAELPIKCCIRNLHSERGYTPVGAIHTLAIGDALGSVLVYGRAGVFFTLGPPDGSIVRVYLLKLRLTSYTSTRRTRTETTTAFYPSLRWLSNGVIFSIPATA